MENNKKKNISRNHYIKIPSESPHIDSRLEWWFIHGYFESSHLKKRYFMSSLFQQTIESEDAGLQHAYSLILSVLDPITGKNEILSQVAPEAVNLFIGAAEEIRKLNLDPTIVDAWMDEVKMNGPPIPIRIERTKTIMNICPFSFSWDSFQLRQSGKYIKMTFNDPDSQKLCQFRMHPECPRMIFEKLEVSGIESMAYASYPRLALTGVVGNEKVKGKAWFDHQWGNYGWLVTSSELNVLGWDWFGINLNNGMDLILIIHRDMKTKDRIAHHAVLFETDREPRLLGKFTVEPLKYWESPITRISYPLSWRISIPEIGTVLTFEPLSENQEIPIFGIIRALWEGAGKVTGIMVGQIVEGRARLELHGYGYIFDFKEYLNHLAKRIDQNILRFFPKKIDENVLKRFAGPPQWKYDPSVQTEILSQPVWDLISRVGKHWRPAFGILMLEALGVCSEPYESLLCVTTEMCHTGALIIDDIEDDSKIRRGDKCIHLRYGLDVAINTANTIYFLPFLLLSNHPHLNRDQQVEIYQLMIQAFVRSHLGQGQDIYWSRNLTIENLDHWIDDSLEPKMLQMYAFKTAAALEGLTETICVIAGSDVLTRKTCASFARNFGVAFQIIDDVHNFSNSLHWRKTYGEDLSSGKLTYVIIRALELLKGTEHNRLAKILCTPELRKDVSILYEGIELVKLSGALQSCREEGRLMVDKAWQALSDRLCSSEPKLMLHLLCSNLVHLEYET